MTTTYTLETVQHAVQIGTKLGNSWFRGHDKKYENLTPKIFRSSYLDSVSEAIPKFERSVIEWFKNKAPVRTKTYPTPAESDYRQWLVLMQHYHTPTRLLDWSADPLVALWFTVAGTDKRREMCEPRDDGELWALFPEQLNVTGADMFGLPVVGRTPELEYLVKKPYFPHSEHLVEDLGIDAPVQAPIAFHPRHRFTRMDVQASRFTIHPSPTRSSCSICDILSDPKHLVRYVVPADCKTSIRRDLIRLGITRDRLFPDFEGLSASINARAVTFDVAARPTDDPPTCGGPWRE